MIALERAEAHLVELVANTTSAAVRPTPNPRVGCRIVSATGEFISEGIHGTDGPDHAEVIALRKAGERARGATAIVTLEPCSHQGKTPPCVAALIAAGIAEVWYSIEDPTEARGGAERLAAAGVEVHGGLRTDLGLPLVEPWLHWRHTARPFVVLKLAVTLDGYIAAKDGSSRWITSEPARSFVHRLRSQSDAVLVGTGTVVADDPRLDVRLEGQWPAPRVFVLGERALPADLAIAGRYQQLRHRDPVLAVEQLAALGVQQVLVEGGGTVAAAFLKAGLVDRLLWIVAPKLLGAGQPAIADLGIANIAAASEWKVASSLNLEPDIALDLRPNR